MCDMISLPAFEAWVWPSYWHLEANAVSISLPAFEAWVWPSYWHLEANAVSKKADFS